jgi:hypothetical protein
MRNLTTFLFCAAMFMPLGCLPECEVMDMRCHVSTVEICNADEYWEEVMNCQHWDWDMQCVEYADYATCEE